MPNTTTSRHCGAAIRGLLIAGAAAAMLAATPASARMAGVIDLTRPDADAAPLVRGPGLTVIRNDNAGVCASGGYVERQRCARRRAPTITTLARPAQPPVMRQQAARQAAPRHDVAAMAVETPARPAMDPQVAEAKRSTVLAMTGQVDCSAPDARFWKECTGVTPLAPVAPAAPAAEPVATPEEKPCEGFLFGLLPCPKATDLAEVWAGDGETPDAPDTPDTPDTPSGPCGA